MVVVVLWYVYLGELCAMHGHGVNVWAIRVGRLVNHLLMDVLWRLMHDRMNYNFVVLFLNLNCMAEPFVLMSMLLLPGDLVNFDIDRFLLVISLFNPLVQVSKHLLRVFDIIVDCVWLCMWIE